jgi:hypothetical protein
MEGLPKQRAELEYEILLLAAICDAAFQQGIAVEKKCKGQLRNWKTRSDRGDTRKAQIESLATASSL